MWGTGGRGWWYIYITKYVYSKRFQSFNIQKKPKQVYRNQGTFFISSSSYLQQTAQSFQMVFASALFFFFFFHQRRLYPRHHLPPTKGLEELRGEFVITPKTRAKAKESDVWMAQQFCLYPLTTLDKGRSSTHSNEPSLQATGENPPA